MFCWQWHLSQYSSSRGTVVRCSCAFISSHCHPWSFSQQPCFTVYPLQNDPCGRSYHTQSRPSQPSMVGATLAVALARSSRMVEATPAVALVRSPPPPVHAPARHEQRWCGATDEQSQRSPLL